MKREIGWTYVGTSLGECRINHITLEWESEAPELLGLLRQIDFDYVGWAGLRPAEALALEAARLLGGQVLESLPDPDILKAEREAELGGAIF